MSVINAERTPMDRALAAIAEPPPKTLLIVASGASYYCRPGPVNPDYVPPEGIEAGAFVPPLNLSHWDWSADAPTVGTKFADWPPDPVAPTPLDGPSHAAMARALP